MMVLGIRFTTGAPGLPAQERNPTATARHVNVSPRSFSEPETPYRNWKYVVIHHSATTSGSVSSIDKEHRQRLDSKGRPWQGIGYHFVIGNGNGLGDGRVEPTFRWENQLSGAHAGQKQFNDYGIGICLIGNFEQAGPTQAQLETLRTLVRDLKQEFQLTDEQLLRHGDLKATACPGKLLNMDLLLGKQSEIVIPVSGEESRSRRSP
ncbi:peptidoglycan recognition protein family protein [Planctomicrobium sp. SH664]|uniref:peptidoglycan recognition protein family protein n=1 Tax=Planctomicrobium sp. SH664 TaxID=3448125 RepID=UPI003F5B7973